MPESNRLTRTSTHQRIRFPQLLVDQGALQASALDVRNRRIAGHVNDVVESQQRILRQLLILRLHPSQPRSLRLHPDENGGSSWRMRMRTTLHHLLPHNLLSETSKTGRFQPLYKPSYKSALNPLASRCLASRHRELRPLSIGN